jgi:hypothetical protein
VRQTGLIIALGGGEEHRVVSEGDLLLTGGPRGPVTLTGVLCVPSLGVNLVSTPQITAKKGSCWESEHHAKVFDPQGRLILLGRKVDGMYQHDVHYQRPQQQASIPLMQTYGTSASAILVVKPCASLQQVML